ncbi:hypothetical protein QAD02_005820 [Eretmocerus hayati]|uniref:Uncharacterized protein n=1 Tax=Eretmocerus hayati TaxID=131215 RepID=A0ACC2NTM0_9HYME|nr:hypothetical protein QAD02_005820 [Eretmocerus hayati]
MSRAVYACRGPLSTFDDTLSELRVFRTIFARFCSEERKNVANYHSKLNCSSMRHPIPNCDDSPREQNCTIWQTCEGSISCGDLKEDTTVCLGKDHDDGHMYEWYAPSKEFKESTCALFHPFRKWEKVDSRVSAPLLLSVTKLERICLSCQCVCNERTYYVSTEVTETDWQKSMVVVGARLAISNDTLFLEVQQGRVSKSGTIYTNDTKWLTPTIGHREKISLETRVAFNLTRVALPQGRVLTGLGLVQRMVDRTSVIGIRVSSQVYNSALGELLSTTAAALNKSVSDQSESEHKNGKSSSHVTQSPPLHSGLGTYVELTVSDGLDGGRSSIPYIDTQKVIPNPLTPLAGAGLYWKEGGISGGFIGVELLTYNILPFLHETSREADL